MMKEYNRRKFIKTSASAVSGLLVCFQLPAESASRLFASSKRDSSTGFEPNAYLQIHQDNRITLWCTRSEMGQGVRTALPMILADELEADWSLIQLEQASPTTKFEGIRLRTSGSGSVQGSWKHLRAAGATAREMLLIAASSKWGIPIEACVARSGFIHNRDTGEKLSYGELSELASQVKYEGSPKLKPSKNYNYIGKAMRRIDGHKIVTGEATYGLDQRMKDMKYAVIQHAPALSAIPENWNEDELRSLKGVNKILAVKEGISHGIAIVADDLWSAMKAKHTIKVDWENGEDSKFDSENFEDRLKESLLSKGFITRMDGDLENVINASGSEIEGIYTYPFQTHAPLETMNCIAHVSASGCEIWVSTQAPETVQQAVAEYLNIEAKNVMVQIPLLGGGFGRRLFVDYVLEAVEISKSINAPVQVVWSRVDDTKFGVFHPATITRMRAVFNEENQLLFVEHKSASSDLSMFGNPSLKTEEYIDGWIPWGGYDNPYHFPAFASIYVHVDSPVPTGAWRAVFYNQNVFARECFVDEIAAKLNHNPMDYRLTQLDFPNKSLSNYEIHRDKLRGVLKELREKSSWDLPLEAMPKHKRGRGMACNIYHVHNFMGYVVEVSVDMTNAIKVDRIICVMDCGQVVNPLGVKGQIESGIVWGLSAALKGKITFSDGGVVESTYEDFEVIKMKDMPNIEIHLIEKDSRPIGVGEPPVPALAPAIANAVFDATGQRLRRIPLRLT